MNKLKRLKHHYDINIGDLFIHNRSDKSVTYEIINIIGPDYRIIRVGYSTHPGFSFNWDWGVEQFLKNYTKIKNPDYNKYWAKLNECL